MKRLRLGAICAGLAAGLAVSYGVLAHDFSALKDGSGSSVRSGFGECVETSGTVGSGANCAKAAAAAAAPAAMAEKKEMATDKKDAMPAAAPAAAAGAAAGTTATTTTAAASSLANVKDGSGKSLHAGAGGCVESSSGSTGGCEPAAAMADKPAAMADKPAEAAEKKSMAPAAAAAATTAAAAGATALGNHQVGEATHGHLADGQKSPVRTGTGGCVNLGYSVNSPDHPADCAFQASKPIAAAPTAAPTAAPAATAPAAAAPAAAAPAAAAPADKPKAAARAVPAAPPAGVPGTVRNTGPAGDGSGAAAMADTGVPDSSDEFPAKARTRAPRGALVEEPVADVAMAKPPAAPPVSVPGTVRNTNPIGAESAGPAAMAAAEPGGETFPNTARPRAPRGALTDDSQPMESAGTSGELKDSPAPPPVPAPPTQVARRGSDSLDVPPPIRSQSSGAGAAPAAPVTDVPGTVRSTAPSGDVQMPAAKPAPIPAPEYEKITLSADVLFKFDRYGEKDMLPGGRAKLDDVAAKINNYIKDTVESIALTGHTDRLGSDAYNQRLSERRAKTVKNYFVKKGIDGTKITDSGHGEREPVVQCQGNKATKKLIKCLQPNRRVDVEIRGKKQK